jgi:hypothetical protein
MYEAELASSGIKAVPNFMKISHDSYIERWTHTHSMVIIFPFPKKRK